MQLDAHGRLDLDCGIALNRIATWLDADLACPRNGDAWHFQNEEAACTIELTDLGSHALSTHDAMQVQRTRLLATGNAQAIESFCHQFVLRFISAGG